MRPYRYRLSDLTQATIGACTFGWCLAKGQAGWALIGLLGILVAFLPPTIRRM